MVVYTPTNTAGLTLGINVNFRPRAHKWEFTRHTSYSRTGLSFKITNQRKNQMENILTIRRRKVKGAKKNFNYYDHNQEENQGQVGLNFLPTHLSWPVIQLYTNQ